jgi:nitrogen regulatory protein PII
MVDTLNNAFRNAKLITCILPKGEAYPLQQELIEKKGIQGVNFHRARGVGRFSPISARGIGEQQEKEILEVTVEEDMADELFEYVFFNGQMNHAHGGIVYMSSLPRATRMTMPDIPQEDS